ncbi:MULTISPECIES: serine/threonine-protein kinase [unclassified Schlesneria]|uniref:serine/threonine-protein kinase n=1 Tax=unclassified Schlesneria TaxID=2762017 RepID=UPI002F1609E7
MNDRHTQHCDHAKLEKLLTESLPEPEESLIAEHLSSCDDCRRDFEVLAAQTNWWEEASQRLARSAARRTVMTNYSPPPYDEDVSHFSSDFAVDFLDPSDDDRSLGRLGEYEVLEVIGRGGMGIVLKCYQQELHRHVAVKVLSPNLATSGAARRRFAREAQATAAVVHPHVMAIHSVNATAKLPFLVMPLVACESLQERLDRKGALELKDILRIGMQTAAGLAAAHSQGLVHRDVKPANILLENNVDRVLLTDFGLARAVDDATLTRTGIIAGTPQYMSPEQANGDAVDRRSDLFSLGGVLYAMCTGRPPFRAETTFGILRRIRETSPRPIREINPDIPAWLERIVMKLLSKDAASRFARAQDVSNLLEACLAHVQQPTTVPFPQGVGDWELRPQEGRSASAGAGRSRRLVGRTVIGLGFCTLAAWGTWNLFTPTDSPMTSVGNDHQQLDGIDAAGASELQKEARTVSVLPHWNDTASELDAVEELVELLEAILADDAEFTDSKHN